MVCNRTPPHLPVSNSLENVARVPLHVSSSSGISCSCVGFLPLTTSLVYILVSISLRRRVASPCQSLRHVLVRIWRSTVFERLLVDVYGGVGVGVTLVLAVF
ncbi:hypothetical protein HanIR_Chr10g0495731 [Helianthus annuus]|nr:hypothetical protein HanIR_Chr10g0495731 [Helianthus annuus]